RRHRHRYAGRRPRRFPQGAARPQRPRQSAGSVPRWSRVTRRRLEHHPRPDRPRPLRRRHQEDRGQERARFSPAHDRMTVALAIRGGTVVTDASELHADLAVDDGRVVQIGGDFTAQREVDARGKLVLPGGVDPHVHLSNPTRQPDEPAWVDDFLSGSAAALSGGITTVGNMTFPLPGERPLAALTRETAVASEQAMADLFLHPVLATADTETLDEIPQLLAHGCSSIKIFLPSPRFDADGTAFTAAVRRAGASGLISMLHCE